MEFGHQTTNDRHPGALHLLPVSAIEQHGPHLPALTDALIISALVRELRDGGELKDVVWLPHLEYGTSDEHQGIAPTISLSPQTFQAVLSDIIESLAQQGVTEVGMINGHGGNVPSLQVAARAALVEHGVRTFFLRPLSTLPGKYGTSLEMHAGAFETSLMMYLNPELVRTREIPTAEGMAASRTDLFRTLEGTNAPQFAWRTRDLTTNGVIGEPSGASSELGRELFDQMLTYMKSEISRIQDLLEDSGS